jgi:hypothetical protein
MNNLISVRSTCMYLLVVFIVTPGFFMAPVAADQIAGAKSPSVSVEGWNSVFFTKPTLSGLSSSPGLYFAPQTGFKTSIPSSFTSLTGQSGNSGQLSGLFSSAMANYYINPPKPITNPVPTISSSSSASFGSSWESVFYQPSAPRSCTG